MRIAFIGGGNMATALIGGILQTQPRPDWIHVSDPNDEARTRIETRFPVQCFSAAEPAIEQADTIILATEPQVMPVVLAELAGIVGPDQQPWSPCVMSAARFRAAGRRTDHPWGQCRVVSSLRFLPAQSHIARWAQQATRTAGVR